MRYGLYCRKNLPQALRFGLIRGLRYGCKLQSVDKKAKGMPGAAVDFYDVTGNGIYFTFILYGNDIV